MITLLNGEESFLRRIYGEKMFPIHRMRRLRKTKTIRDIVAETVVIREDLICPVFVTIDKTSEIPSMPGIFRKNLTEVVEYVAGVKDQGISSFIFFGIPEKKDGEGSEAWSPKGVVQRAISAIKEANLDVTLITDVCLCQYTDHGHCGNLDSNGTINNDLSLKSLSKTAVSHVQAGADFVAPSDMMDGRVGAIRTDLDENGFTDIGIIAYSAKYKSSFYGPFRDAADSSPKSGDRSTYQMDYRNLSEALHEVELDLNEGADIVMVKPALAYLDVIKAVRDEFNVPIAAYNVSGEFSMIKAAGAKGWIDEKAVALEILTAIKRAGATAILTYFANDIIDILP